MTGSVIRYDKDLPEIPGRMPWEPPTNHLVKDETAGSGWRVAAGRRPSNLLLIAKIRSAVDTWREQGYPDVSETTRRLLEYWFEEDHAVPDFNVPFRYYFCQREAIETLVWLVECCDNRDARALIEDYGSIHQVDLVSRNITFQTLTGGTRQMLYGGGEKQVVTRDLPPQDLRRYAFKMATGSGKTWVMAMAIVWAFFHKKRVPGSDLSTNVLVVAPNVIVYQRLEKDFAGNRLFNSLPLVPPEWRGEFSLKVILRGESTEPDPSGNVFLSNIHQLYESREQEWTPRNAVDALLGKKPAQNADQSGGRTMLKRVQSLPDVLVLNDEAHHVHDDTLEWSKSLLSIHRALPGGLSLWLDFSATPKDEKGYFPWTVCDYPLAQAVEDRIVKAPLIVTKEDDPKRPDQDPDNVTAENVVEKYGYWLQAAVQRWKEHQRVYKTLGTKPVLFIMAEKSNQADAIGNYLGDTTSFGLKPAEVLVIHTDKMGDIQKKDLEEARKLARDIDTNEIKVIVSVLMLREGWDVRNVSVVLGLRPFSAPSEILPEQVIGRGLRLMTTIGPERMQTLEVLGTRRLLDFLREQLEADGVGVASTKSDPPLPVVIAPVKEKKQYDIQIPLTRPSLSLEVRNLDRLNLSMLEAIYDRKELDEVYRINLRMEFQPTDTTVHQAAVAIDESIESILFFITRTVMARARLTLQFAALYPKVKTYVERYCFGGTVDLNDSKVLSNLSRQVIKSAIIDYLARAIGTIMLEKREIELEKADFRLSETKEFAWRRDLPPLQARKTVFNFVATFNKFERQFAEFLDRAPDVLRFASLGTTEQGESGTQFRVDYLKPTGAIGFYSPDWAVVQDTPDGEVNWIIETKGRVWPGTTAKDDAINRWCEHITRKTNTVWRYQRIQQTLFASKAFGTLGDLLDKAKPEPLPLHQTNHPPTRPAPVIPRKPG